MLNGLAVEWGVVWERVRRLKMSRDIVGCVVEREKGMVGL